MQLLPNNLSLTNKSVVVLFSILFLNIIGTISFVSAEGLKNVPPVITVNGIVMEQAELDQQINKIIDSAKGRIPAEQTDKFKASIQGKIIDNFVTLTLIKAECNKLKIKVTKKELDDKLNEYTKRLPKGMDLNAALKQTGMGMKELNDNIKFGLQFEKLIALKTKDLPAPTEAEIKEYYENNSKKFSTPAQAHARHILIKTDSKDNETVKSEKKAKIDSLRVQLTKGEDFAKLAKENSDCPSGKAKGGDLGTFSRGRMVKPFEDAAFNQKVNDIGPVIETRFGFHIIQVLEINEAKTKTIEESRDNIVNNLNMKQKSKITQELITKLKESAKIDYADAYKPKVK
jgi:peptidyl-prolyl cis-trans isomerase C